MMRMFKYELPHSRTSLRVPEEGLFKHVAVQRGISSFAQGEVPCVWALVDPDAPLIAVEFALVPTGRQAPTPTEGTYLGTVHLLGGTYVLHVFYVWSANWVGGQHDGRASA